MPNTVETLQSLVATAKVCGINDGLVAESKAWLKGVEHWTETQGDYEIDGAELIGAWSMNHYPLMSPRFWQIVVGDPLPSNVYNMASNVYNILANRAMVSGE